MDIGFAIRIMRLRTWTVIAASPACPSFERARSVGRTNDVLVASDRRLNKTTAAVTGRLLPGHAVLLRNDSDMTVTDRLAFSFGRNDR